MATVLELAARGAGAAVIPRGVEIYVRSIRSTCAGASTGSASLRRPSSSHSHLPVAMSSRATAGSHSPGLAMARVSTNHRSASRRSPSGSVTAGARLLALERIATTQGGRPRCRPAARPPLGGPPATCAARRARSWPGFRVLLPRAHRGESPSEDRSRRATEGPRSAVFSARTACGSWRTNSGGLHAHAMTTFGK